MGETTPLATTGGREWAPARWDNPSPPAAVRAGPSCFPANADHIIEQTMMCPAGGDASLTIKPLTDGYTDLIRSVTRWRVGQTVAVSARATTDVWWNPVRCWNNDTTYETVIGGENFFQIWFDDTDQSTWDSCTSFGDAP